MTAAILPFPSHSQQSPPPDMEKNVTKHINIELRKKKENPEKIKNPQRKQKPKRAKKETRKQIVKTEGKKKKLD